MEIFYKLPTFATVPPYVAVHPLLQSTVERCFFNSAAPRERPGVPGAVEEMPSKSKGERDASHIVPVETNAANHQISADD